jgi:nucleotide-binding universal stress UspA family protein
MHMPYARDVLPDVLSAEARRVRHGLLIATDGRPAADAAVIIGSAIARRDGEPFEIVAVEPLDAYQEDLRATPGPTHDMHFRLSQQRDRATDSAAESWPLMIAYGDAGATISDLAYEGRRRLIVLGLHVHSRMDRVLGRDTVLRALPRASCPVLAVDSNRRTIPRRVLVATDFSRSSIAAAREALRLVGDSGTLYLAHVAARTTIPFDARATADYETDTGSLMTELRGTLACNTSVKVHDVVLRGDPVHELLAFAEQEGIELIACGTRGFGPLRGAVVGRVPTALVRAARCSMLVVPPLTE